ncbi:alpha/beta hydrolase [Protofrankia symbiont of Coriaria ruscifolia]|uniref:alpha/beta hydrolase n=1 Tax=Protofrankia symbiont of Coriaria ruscifolia TaxID=1306542 RepID=UPI0010410350|nr:alpha/beta hydrolase fold domain-containing protein [Protofrankia symbiont of Coriaria ruscifolia]
MPPRPRGRPDQAPADLLVTAEYDVLRDEGIDYAARLRDAGVPVAAVHYDGLIHGFFWMAKVVDEARDLPDRIARWLHATLIEPVNARVD